MPISRDVSTQAENKDRLQGCLGVATPTPKTPEALKLHAHFPAKNCFLYLPKLRSLDGKKKSKWGQPSEHFEEAWVWASGSWCVLLLTLKTGHHVSAAGCLFIPCPNSGHNHPSSADEETEVITVQILLLYHFYCYTRFQDHRHLLSWCGRVRGRWSPKDSWWRSRLCGGYYRSSWHVCAQDDRPHHLASPASGAGAGRRSRRKQGGGGGEGGWRVNAWCPRRSDLQNLVPPLTGCDLGKLWTSKNLSFMSQRSEQHFTHSDGTGKPKDDCPVHLPSCAFPLPSPPIFSRWCVEQGLVTSTCRMRMDPPSLGGRDDSLDLVAK